MFECLYIEKDIFQHPRSLAMQQRYSDLPCIEIGRYGEVFNRNAQNFRLQKSRPSLILAQKFGEFILPTPQGYGIGGTNNYYFSHMLNCIYDCRYCFLQGMYNSANYVLFVNYEDFFKSIEEKILSHSSEESYFFSGYDCDSLALESITHFAQTALPVFAKYKQAFLELRTKSTNIQFLLKTPPLANCITAFSLTPHEISQALEHRTPSLKRRLIAIKQLQDYGWPIGLRFDPLIYCENFKEIYTKFFQEVFQVVNIHKLHSVSLGLFRLPKEIYKKMLKLYPDEKLFAHSLEERKQQISYGFELEKMLMDHCQQEILSYIPPKLLFPCELKNE